MHWLADQTRITNRLRDALTSISPALERALGARLAQAGVRDLLAKYPTLTALRAAGQARINRVVKARSPRLAAKVTDAVNKALHALPAQTSRTPRRRSLSSGASAVSPVGRPPPPPC